MEFVDKNNHLKSRDTQNYKTSEMPYCSTNVYDFLDQGRISESLTTLFENQITGWEKWLQTEFILYMHKIGFENQIIQEKSIIPNKSSKEKTIRPDVILLTKSSFYIYEFKQNKSPETCLKKIKEDINKNLRIRQYEQQELPLRKITGIGITTYNEEFHNQLVESSMSNKSLISVHFFQIKDSNVGCLIAERTISPK